MRRARSVIAVLCVLVAAGTVAAPAGAAGSVACQEAVIFNPDGGLYTQTRALSAVAVSCAKARQVAGRYLSTSDDRETDPRPGGFTCTAAKGRVRCVRGASSVRWSYYGASDPSCENAPLGVLGVGYDVTAGGVSCSAVRPVIKAVSSERNGGGNLCTVKRPCSQAGYRCISQALADLQFRVRCYRHGRRFAYTYGFE